MFQRSRGHETFGEQSRPVRVERWREGTHGVQVGEVGFGKEQGNLEIKITPTATIEQGVGETPPAATKPIGAPAAEQPAPAAPTQPSRPPEVRQRSYGYTMNELLDLWNAIVTDPRVDAGNPDITQRAAACVFIQATKDGLKVPEQPANV